MSFSSSPHGQQVQPSSKRLKPAYHPPRCHSTLSLMKAPRISARYPRFCHIWLYFPDTSPWLHLMWIISDAICFLANPFLAQVCRAIRVCAIWLNCLLFAWRLACRFPISTSLSKLLNRQEHDSRLARYENRSQSWLAAALSWKCLPGRHLNLP